MPLHQLRVIPADVSGSGLRLALNAAAAPTLASSTLTHPGGADLVLGVLGASHVIRVQQFCEQVSCTPLPDDSALPASMQTLGYRLTSDISTLDETAFRRVAADLRDSCAHRDGWLGGTFPGDDAALTALCAEPDGPGWRWQTWHLYPERDCGVAPGGGTIVHTASRWQP